MLAEYDFILAKVLLRCVPLHRLHGHLILKEFFSGRLKSLLLDRAWNVAFLQDAPWNEDIIVDAIVNAELIRRQKEAIEVILVLATMLVRGQTCRPIYIDDSSMPDSMRLRILDHRAESVHGLLLASVAFGEIVCTLQLLDVLDELSL